MPETLRGWLKGRAGPAPRDQTATMSTALGILYLAGAAIGAASLVLPHPARFDDPALWSNVGLGAAAGVALLLGRRWVALWTIQLGVLAGTAVITRALYHADGVSFYAFWYLWVGVYAAFFLGRGWGSAHLAIVGAAFAWVLAGVEASVPVARWVVTIGSIAVVSLLVGTLAGRLRAQTRAADSRAANLEAVHEIARQLATQSDPRAVGWAICTAALRTTGAAATVLWRPEPSGRGLLASAASGVQAEGGELPFVTQGSGAIRAFTGAETRFADLAEGDSAQELAPGFEAGAALWEPVLIKGAVVGVLAAYWDEPLERVGEETSQALKLLALEAAIAIERGELLGRLEEAARTDDLTGLPNRRAWSEELSREVSRAQRTGEPLAVAVLDLDQFKQYNDEHGHQAGDRFLKQVAGIWSEELRATDILARHGGEEFVLAMPATALEASERMLERLRSTVPDDQTVSAGVCIWDGSEDPDALVARADVALYAAKAGGRDRIVGR